MPYAFAQASHEPAGPVRFALTGPQGEPWTFGEDDAPTTVRGPATDLCAVAGQRLAAAQSDLEGHGPDADAVLRLVRTFA